MGNNPFNAQWSRSGNLLCHGHWVITYHRVPVILPEPYLEKNLETKGIYSIIDPDDELYLDGLDEDDWILKNVEWLADCFIDNEIPLDEMNFRYFWQAVNPHDWRCTSCAGCM
ncbi:MAG TPA: hypothetical protein VJY99_09885 [Buttiauxella sp.]|uniref:hypothetical protein n=1 Tax=Buttiauxella sp. TaxID=1972222 RepID=UPI002B4A91EC|nr:hypothetical protein [Buttiauxella sp.]HKM96990.1 hypothetical protein [Buttiauxella sp.]